VSDVLRYGSHIIEDVDLDAVVAALRSDKLTQGSRVAEFECALAEYTGASHAVAVSSGSAALHLACIGLGLRDQAADGSARVATAPLSFVATANAIVHCGAQAHFVDVGCEDWNLCPDRLAQSFEDPALGPLLRGVIPIDFAGHPCDIESIATLARAHRAFVIRDACHALGARWIDRSGLEHRVGDCGYSDATVLSFHPVKHITTAEGGAILTSSAALAQRCRELRENGLVRDTCPDAPWVYEMHSPGFNYRLSDLHCALGLAQLQRLDGWLARRREIAHRYDELFAGVPEVVTPAVGPGVTHAYHLYVIRVSDRARVFHELRAQGIGVQVHYVPIHKQPYYRKRQPGLRLPEAEAYYARALSIPIHAALLDADVLRVVEAVKRAVVETRS